MAWIFNLAYLLVLVAASPWLLWRCLRRGKYRRGVGPRLLGSLPFAPDGRRPLIWFHGVSVGEVKLLQPLLQRWAAACPDSHVVVSATTETGFDLARRLYPDLDVFFSPLDFSWSVRRVLRKLRPRMLVLAELELWPNLLREAGRRGVEVVVVNGRLGDRSARGYRRLGPVARAMFRHLDLVLAQNETYAERFRALGCPPERVHVTGSLKFDGARLRRDHPDTRRLARLWNVPDGDPILISGSTQAPEERIGLAVVRRLRESFPSLRWIVVPRHRERFEDVARLLDLSGETWDRRSLLDNGRTPTARTLLVDTIGELSAWWGLADIAFVGGSLGNDRGGQNMIEPAAYGAAVCFGPGTHHFRDVVAALLEDDAATVVADEQAFEAFVRDCLEDPPTAAARGQRARRVVQRQLGAADRTCDHLQQRWSRDVSESRVA